MMWLSLLGLCGIGWAGDEVDVAVVVESYVVSRE